MCEWAGCVARGPFRRTSGYASARYTASFACSVEHMGREKTISAALQLQHDAGLILSNVQILQQLVTALHGASANVMEAVRGHQPFPTQAMQHALPSGGVVRAAHYMMVMGLWLPPIPPGIQVSLPVAACEACMSSGVCFPKMPKRAERRSQTDYS